MQKIEEAFKNPILKKADKIVGETKAGMHIAIVFCSHEGQVKILTAYPLYNQDVIKASALIKQLGKAAGCLEAST